MLILAHRGASADAPENTLAAFEEAVRQGADGVELDAMACGSGEIVVCHDEKLTRLAGREWEVVRTPYWKLKRADIGTHWGGSAYAGAGVPLLEEVIDALPKHFVINIELKNDTVEDFGLCEGAARLVARMNVADRVVFSSFNPLCLWRVAQFAPYVRRGFLIDPDRSFFAQNACVAPLVSTYSVHPCFTQITEERVHGWSARGWNIAAWTVDDPDEARRLRELGVAYCITNKPGLMKRSL
ncbi:MAG: glycerophosphodiester phosphodiesterase [Myxococcaceae bacterium]